MHCFREVTPVSDVHAGTREVRRFRLSGHGHSMVITDLPGWARAGTGMQSMKPCTVTFCLNWTSVLWLIKADDRALSVDEYFWRHILHRGHQRVLFKWWRRPTKRSPAMNGIWPVFPAFSRTGTEHSEKRMRYSGCSGPYIGCCRIGPHRLGTGYAGQCAPWQHFPTHAASPLMTRLRDELRTGICPRSGREQFTGAVDRMAFDTAEKASALPLFNARFCVPSVTRWSLLPRCGTGFSSYEILCCGNAWLHYVNQLKTWHKHLMPLLFLCVTALLLIE